MENKETANEEKGAKDGQRENGRELNTRGNRIEENRRKSRWEMQRKERTFKWGCVHGVCGRKVLPKEIRNKNKEEWRICGEIVEKVVEKNEAAAEEEKKKTK